MRSTPSLKKDLDPILNADHREKALHADRLKRKGDGRDNRDGRSQKSGKR